MMKEFTWYAYYVCLLLLLTYLLESLIMALWLIMAFNEVSVKLHKVSCNANKEPSVVKGLLLRNCLLLELLIRRLDNCLVYNLLFTILINFHDCVHLRVCCTRLLTSNEHISMCFPQPHTRFNDGDQL